MNTEPTDSESRNEEIRRRVSWCHEGVVMVREVPVMTRATVDLIFDEIVRLTKGEERYAILFDVTESAHPNVRVRDHLRARLRAESGRLGHVALYTKSFLAQVGMRFLLGDLPVDASHHRERNDALAAALASARATAA